MYMECGHEHKYAIMRALFCGSFGGLVGLVGVGIVEWGVGRGADCSKGEGWVFCLVV